LEQKNTLTKSPRRETHPKCTGYFSTVEVPNVAKKKSIDQKN